MKVAMDMEPHETGWVLNPVTFRPMRVSLESGNFGWCIIPLADDGSIESSALGSVNMFTNVFQSKRELFRHIMKSNRRSR